MNDPNAKCSSEISETNNDDNDDSNNDNSSNEFSDGHLASSSSKLRVGEVSLQIAAAFTRKATRRHGCSMHCERLQLAK